MKKMSEQMQKQMNGGAVHWFHPYAVQCTTCYESYSNWTRKSVRNWGEAHYKKNYTKKAPHRWDYLREG